jgi:hypothetical protein
MSKPQPKKFIRIAPGARVTCRYRAGHQGIVIADDDPRAWAGSIAFPSPTPSQAEVTAHVAHCKQNGWGSWHEHPVLWDFGKIYWDTGLSEVAVAAVITDEELAAAHA